VIDAAVAALRAGKPVVLPTDTVYGLCAEPTEPALLHGREVFLAGPCALCHTIAGTTAAARLGPDLTHFASRTTLAAGTLPNDLGALAAWLVDPQSVKPGVHMPSNALAAKDLRDLLDYLQTLK